MGRWNHSRDIPIASMVMGLKSFSSTFEGGLRGKILPSGSLASCEAHRVSV